MKRLITDDFQRVFNDLKCDLLVTPTCFHDTATFHEYLTNEKVYDEKDFFTACANIAGLPAITVPACLSKSGLPVGIQLIGIQFCCILIELAEIRFYHIIIANWNCENLLIDAANWFIGQNQLNFPYYEKPF